MLCWAWDCGLAGAVRVASEVNRCIFRSTAKNMIACTKCPQTRSPVPLSASITQFAQAPKDQNISRQPTPIQSEGIFYNLSLSPPPLTISLKPQPPFLPPHPPTPLPPLLPSPLLLLSSPPLFHLPYLIHREPGTNHLTPPREGSQQPACQSGERRGARGMGTLGMGDGGWEMGDWGMGDDA